VRAVLLTAAVVLAAITAMRPVPTAPVPAKPAVSRQPDVPPPAQEGVRPMSLGRFLVLPRVPDRPMNYLVAGVTPNYSGYRQVGPETFTGLTDSLLLVQLDPAANRIRTLSLPRDTRVVLSDRQTHKLNAALPLFGPAELVQQVERLTGLTLDGYLLVNLNAVRTLTEAVGGVELLVPVDMDYDDIAAKLHIHLKRGRQRLNGEQAEGFLRFRYDALGDIGRAQRQQTYIRALAARLMTASGLSRLPAVSQVLEQTTRTNVQDTDVAAVLGMVLKRPALETYLLPGSFMTSRGVSYWNPDAGKTRRMLAGFGTTLAGDTPAAAQPNGQRVALVAAGATPERLRALRDRLLRLGYRNVVISEQPAVPRETTVVLSNINLAEAQTLRANLGFGEARASGEGLLWADLTVWVANDVPHLPVSPKEPGRS